MTKQADLDNVKEFRKSTPCPICKKNSQWESRPFCSERCRQIDLGKWLNGSYAIAAVEGETEGDADYEIGENIKDQ